MISFVDVLKFTTEHLHWNALLNMSATENISLRDLLCRSFHPVVTQRGNHRAARTDGGSAWSHSPQHEKTICLGFMLFS